MNIRKIVQKPLPMLVLASVLAFFSSWPAFFLLRQGLFLKESAWFSLATAISALVMMFVLPVILIKFVFGRELRDFGLVLPPNMRSAVKWSSLLVLVFLPVMVLLSKQTAFQNYYAVKDSLFIFILLSLVTNGTYYFAEEFLFRGFLQFGLWNKLQFNSFWIVNLLFAFFHLGKPLPEVFLAFFLGMSLSYLSYKTKSFIPAVIVHFILAFVLNLLINYLIF